MARKKKTTKAKAAKKKTARRKRVVKGWTTAEVNKLRKLFPNNPTAKIARQLGRKTDAVKKKASRMGLRKNSRYLKSLGRA